MNKKQKGHKAENDLAKALKNQEYKVQVAQRTSVFTGKFYISRDNDFFNLFDLLAINNYDVLLIQVKTNVNHIYPVLKEIRDFSNVTKNTYITYVAALKVPRKGWVFWAMRYPVDEDYKIFYNLKLEIVEPFKYS